MKLRATASAFALGMLAAACSQGSNIASPGATTPTTPPTTGGGTGGGGGTPTASCPTGFTQDAATTGGLTTCVVSGTITSDLTLPFVSGTAYRLSGRVDVGVDVGADGTQTGGDPAVLTIEPGVTVFGRSGDDYLVVNRGSQLMANGGVNTPIVFTSDEDLDRQNDADTSNDDGGDNTSEWGGLVILGQAPINDCVIGSGPLTASCENEVEGVQPQAVFGGAETGDNSGSLRYVQVRFAGFPTATNNELNGITFGGVGDGTTVEYVQVHNNSDDGVEFFGGTVNVKYLVLTGNDDDSIDSDLGWQGKIQYAVIRQRAASGDNLFEASSTTGAARPLAERTNYQISNFTAIGFERGNGIRLNEGHVGRFMNGIVIEETECFRWQDAGNDNTTFEAAEDPSFNSVLFDCGTALVTTDTDPNDASTSNGTTVAPLAVAADANNTQGLNSLAGLLPGANEAAVTAFDASSVDSFFDATSYIGAFAPTDTETSNWAAGWTFALFPDATCPTGTTDSGTDINGQNVCQISGAITTDVRLTRGNIYELIDRVDVGVDVGKDGMAAAGDPGTLTIESGVTIFGNSGDDYLVVNRGSQLFANGTSTAPVVFTSLDDVNNSQSDPANAQSEWGGLVLLGRSPINDCAVGSGPMTVDCENEVEGVQPQALFGGATTDDNSGVLRYVQVKYAGFPTATNNELNGITFGGVGDDTIVEYVQVHNNSDDGVEFFGGTVNAKYLVLTGNDDDSIDSDLGWQGKIQYAIIIQRALSGDNLFEASSTTGAARPLAERTNYQISNFTAVGFQRGNGVRLNEGHVGRFMNGIVVEETECFRWQDAGNDNATFEAAEDPSFNSVLFDCGTTLVTTTTDPDDDSTANGVIVAPLAVAADANNTETTNDLQSAVAGGPAFINGSSATAEASVTAIDANAVDTFFETTTYIGAVENVNDTWWQGWSCGLDNNAC